MLGLLKTSLLMDLIGFDSRPTPPRLLLFEVIGSRCLSCEMHDTSDWMAQHFSTDGVMPSDYLLLHFKETFRVPQHWRFSGVHYQKTSEAWLARLSSILHGMRLDARGNEWIVSRYLFRNSANCLKGGQAS